jgi:hypothetical protein
VAVVIPLNNFLGPADDTVTAQTYYRIQNTVLQRWALLGGNRIHREPRTGAVSARARQRQMRRRRRRLPLPDTPHGLRRVSTDGIGVCK